MSSFAEAWVNEELIFSGDELYDRIFELMGAASQRIDIEMYIFEIDMLGERVLVALEEAAQRGVQVRLLLDSVGSIKDGRRIEERLRGSLVEVRLYHRFFERDRWLSLSRLNRRNHRKVWIFDKKVAIVSSANVTRVHLSRSRGGEGWKDASVRVQGEGVTALFESMEVAWKKPSFLPAQSRRRVATELLDDSEGHDGDLVHLNDTRSRRRSLRLENLRRVTEASERVWLANAYFAPGPRFVSALKKAARRGVDVRILVPKHSDVFFMPLVATTYYRTLLDAGVKLYHHVCGGYHAKIRVIDGHHLVGSSNLDFRSLLYNLEVDVLVTHPQNQDRLLTDLKESFLKAEPITFDTVNGTPVWVKGFAWVLSLFRFWF